MKKALVLLLALTLVGGFMFAEDEVVPRSDAAPTISGYGQVTWGANFEAGATGFQNAAEIRVVFPLISQDSTTHGGDAITGEVTISDLKMVIAANADGSPAFPSGDGGDDDQGPDALGDLSAKIKFPNNLYVGVYGAPGFELNNAISLAPLYNDSWDNNRTVLKANIGAATTGGISIGMTGDFNFAVKLASVNDYNSAAAAGATTYATYIATGTETDATGILNADGTPAALPLIANRLYIKSTAGAAAKINNTDNLYAAGLDLGYTVKDLMSVAAGLEYGPFSDAGVFAFTVKATVNPKDSGLSVVAALDGQINDDVIGMDAMFTVDYTMTKLFSVGAGAYYGDLDTNTDGGSRLDARVRAALLAVENLTFEVGTDMWDLMADPALDPMWIDVNGKVAYTIKQGDVNYVKPYAEVCYALNDAALAVKLGVEAKQFPRTVLTAQYAAGGFPANNTVTSATNAFEDDLGTFTLCAKVSY